MLFASTTVLALARLVATEERYGAARDEYAALGQARDEPPHRGEEQGPVPGKRPEVPPTAQDPRELNPDFVGWIDIPGTAITYPVVAGHDNEEYLSTTFAGTQNAAGAIFMDSRCSPGFDESLCVIYGHNMRDGSMFAGLNQYLDDEYAEQHGQINVVTADGDRRVYVVTSVRVTNTDDPVFGLPGAAPLKIREYLAQLGLPDSTTVIALSTCTDSRSPDERLVVLATRSQSPART
ncbi:MAG: class B sortase [Bifidobacteriaceae bacterium]|jgi:SrtB family sortase|nr:class B sortase [Bifidobacteriaceae bacterium]